MLLVPIMRQSLSISLLLGVLIMNMGMFCHSLCIGGHHEKAGGHQHSASAHGHRITHHQMVHQMSHQTAAHQMTEKAPQGMPHGENCPMGQGMRQGKPDSAGIAMPETLRKCVWPPEGDPFPAIQATLLKPIIA